MTNQWTDTYQAFKALASPTLKDLSDTYRCGVRCIRQMTDELEMIRDTIVPATSRLTHAPGGHGGTPGDPTGAAAARILTLEENIKAVQADLEALRLRLCRSIAHSIDNDSDRVIYHRRCVAGDSYQAIATEMRYTVGHCRSVVYRCGQLPA